MMSGGWEIDVAARPGIRGRVLVVRVALAGFTGPQAQIAGLADGGEVPVECARCTPLGAVALEMARARLDAARVALTAEQRQP